MLNYPVLKGSARTIIWYISGGDKRESDGCGAVDYVTHFSGTFIKIFAQTLSLISLMRNYCSVT